MPVLWAAILYTYTRRIRRSVIAFTLPLVRAVVVALGLLAAGMFALSAQASERARAHPRLLVSTQPVVRVQGLSFRRHERVKVTVVTSTRHVRHVTASSSGRFTVRFAGVHVGRCGGFSVTAAGSLGSIASAHIQRPACMLVAPGRASSAP
jgi:hypothetical protein